MIVKWLKPEAKNHNQETNFNLFAPANDSWFEYVHNR